MKHILVPIDFSECSIHALKFAAGLAHKTGATIHMAHIYDLPGPAITLQFEVDDNAHMNMRKSISDEMDALMQADYMSGLVVVKHYITDKAIWNLMELQSMQDIDLVIMGSHGASGAKEFFIGSNTQKMVQSSPIPVLVVKADTDPDLINDIAFVSNFYGEASSAFAPIRSFADVVGARVHLLKIITPSNFEDTAYSERLMEDFAQSVGLQEYTVNTYNTLNIERGVQEFTSRTGIDLIAMETHGRTGLAHWLQGSKTEHVVNHADLPVLSMKIEPPDYHYGVIFPESK